MRSFLEKPGFKYSSLARILPCIPFEILASSTNGVSPIASTAEESKRDDRSMDRHPPRDEGRVWAGPMISRQLTVDSTVPWFSSGSPAAGCATGTVAHG